MRKIIFIIILITIFSKSFCVSANDKSKEVSYSANISYNKILYSYLNRSLLFSAESKMFYKKYAIKNVLERYNSPLINNIDDFIDVCLYYKINCYLLPAIAGLESTFGYYILPDSYNPFGWGGGYIIFKNWADGIHAVAKGLKHNYFDCGLKTVEEIGLVYSESPNWAKRVQFFMNEFEKEEENLRLYFEKNEVKL